MSIDTYYMSLISSNILSNSSLSVSTFLGVKFHGILTQTELQNVVQDMDHLSLMLNIKENKVKYHRFGKSWSHVFRLYL